LKSQFVLLFWFILFGKYLNLWFQHSIMENLCIFCSLGCADTSWNILYFYVIGDWHSLFWQVLYKTFFFLQRVLCLIELAWSVYVSSDQLTGRWAAWPQIQVPTRAHWQGPLIPIHTPIPTWAPQLGMHYCCSRIEFHASHPAPH